MTADSKVFLSVKNMDLKYLMHLYNSSQKVFQKNSFNNKFEALQRVAKDNWVYEIPPVSPLGAGHKLILHNRLVRRFAC